jgi:hypothetical protein
LLLPLWTSHPGSQKPAGPMVVLQNLPCVQSLSTAHPQNALAWQTGVFSGLHWVELVAEHCVQWPDDWHAGND